VLNRLSTVRLRTAFGQAGVQPAAVAKLRLYTRSYGAIDGVEVNPISLWTAGNPSIRPERTREFEGGLDLGFADDRIRLEATAYRKNTVDALVKLDLPWSLGDLRHQRSMMNVGNVSNTGLELLLEARILDNANFGWSTTTSYSRNSNILKHLGRAPLETFTYPSFGVRFVEGYPLYGYWGRPLLSYKDANNDGIIGPSEVALADSMVYLGNSSPNYETNIHNTFTLFRNVTINATIQYQNDMNQLNEGMRDTRFSRAVNDPSTALSTQALYLVATCQYGSNSCNTYALAQRISVLRFQSLSIGYVVPASLLKHVNIRRQLSLSLQGSNLGLITNYRGKDPNVNGSMGDLVTDGGVLPMPRTWQLTFRF
jgi:hypothetical protein